MKSLSPHVLKTLSRPTKFLGITLEATFIPVAVVFCYLVFGAFFPIGGLELGILSSPLLWIPALGASYGVCVMLCMRDVYYFRLLMHRTSITVSHIDLKRTERRYVV